MDPDGHHIAGLYIYIFESVVLTTGNLRSSEFSVSHYLNRNKLRK